jgi:hypothetical protein
LCSLRLFFVFCGSTLECYCDYLVSIHLSFFLAERLCFLVLLVRWGFLCRA